MNLREVDLEVLLLVRKWWWQVRESKVRGVCFSKCFVGLNVSSINSYKYGQDKYIQNGVSKLVTILGALLPAGKIKKVCR